MLLFQASFSLNFTPHVGRTDGEAPERGWAATNAVANSTKEMGPGSRQDTLDDHFSDYNWRKVSSMCGSTSICVFKLLIIVIFLAVTFLRKVKEAVPAWDEHLLAFEEFNAALPAASTKEWTTCVEAWELDNTKPNPFHAKLASKLFIRISYCYSLFGTQLFRNIEYGFNLQRRIKQSLQTAGLLSFTTMSCQACL